MLQPKHRRRGRRGSPRGGRLRRRRRAGCWGVRAKANRGPGRPRRRRRRHFQIGPGVSWRRRGAQRGVRLGKLISLCVPQRRRRRRRRSVPLHQEHLAPEPLWRGWRWRRSSSRARPERHGRTTGGLYRWWRTACREARQLGRWRRWMTIARNQEAQHKSRAGHNHRQQAETQAAAATRVLGERHAILFVSTFFSTAVHSTTVYARATWSCQARIATTLSISKSNGGGTQV